MWTRIDIVGAAEARAVQTALADRLRFRPFFEAAERFAAAEGLVVCGPAAARLLRGGPAAEKRGQGAAPAPVAAVSPPVTLDSFQCDFYSERPAADARALAQALYQVDPEGLGRYTTVRTKVPSHLLAISVDGRDLFGIVSLPAIRGKGGGAALAPWAAQRPAQFASGPDGAPVQLLVVGPWLQLVGVYAALCDPARAGDWPALLADEAALRAGLGAGARAVEGGRGRGRRGRAADDAKAAQTTQTSEMGDKRDEACAEASAPRSAASRLRRALLEGYVGGAGRALVGAAAVALLTGRSPSERRLQVVTAGDLAAEGRAVAALAAKAGIEASWKLEDPCLPVEPRLRRLTVFAVGARREPVLDAFNAAAFDLVPVGPPPRLTDAPGGAWPAGLRVGTPFAIMRFLLVDLWVARLLLHLGAVAAGFAAEVRARVLADFGAVAAHYEDALGGAAADPEGAARRVLPLRADSYIGALEDLETTMKREAGDTAFYVNYMPAARASRGGALQARALPEGLGAAFGPAEGLESENEVLASEYAEDHTEPA